MTQVNPALTPEQWAVKHYNLKDFDSDIQVFPPDPVMGRVEETLSVGGCCYDYSYHHSYHHDAARHALAALALVGQPFGFTWDDVDALHRVVQSSVGDWTPNNSELRALDIADRIAALLPPREAKP